ncbi:MAG: aldo/keto reductase, partial [Ktedonobacterales bacterium]
VDTCTQDGLAFIAWAPLASGQFPRVGGRINQIAHRHGANPAQISIAWLLQQSPVLLPIPGTCSIHHLEENVAAAGIRLGQGELGQMNRRLVYWHLYGLVSRGARRIGKYLPPTNSLRLPKRISKSA